jgi:hypothetical protein
MPTVNTSLKDIAAAIADELQLSDSELLSVSQVTVSVTYQVDRQAKQDDWLDEWYEEFKQRDMTPF